MDEKITANYKHFDRIAMEALAAGIGIGELSPQKKQQNYQQAKAKSMTQQALPVEEHYPPLKTETLRRRWYWSMTAYFIDTLLMLASIIVAAVASHYVMLDELPQLTDLLIFLVERFEYYQIAIAISSLVLGYFVLFKVVAGLTLGESLIKGK